jgi:hypothetical protein
MSVLLPARGSRITTPLERATSMAEFAPSVEMKMREMNHQYHTGRPLTGQQVYPPLQVEHRFRGIVVDSGPAIVYNVSAWELLQRRKVLPCKSFLSLVF